MRWLPLLLITCATPALAQPHRDSTPDASLEHITETVGPGTLASPLSLLNAVEINASEEGSSASISLGTQISDPGGSFHSLSITASAPLDEDTHTAFTALDPFANGVALEGRYTFTQLLGMRDPVAAGYRICEEVQQASGVPMGDDGCSSAYIQANARERLREYNNLYFRRPTVLFAGVRGRVGRTGFTFLDPGSGAETDSSRTPWMIGGFVGFSHLPWHNSFSIGFRHQRRFKEASTAAVCPGTPGVTICPVGPVGPPTERIQNVLSGEFRQRVGRHFAFSIEGSYDFESNVFQLDIPAYFISNGNLGLNAGLRARYVHDPDPDDLNEGWVFGIFVSKSFSLFGG